MKTITKYQSTAIFIAISFLSISIVFAQGNSGNNGQGKLWEKNSDGNIFNTGLTNFVGIGKDDPQFPLDVNGQITSDSMRVKGLLHIGDSSLVLGGTPLAGGTDNIQSSNGIINFGRYAGAFYNIQLGVGTQTPQSKMHLFQKGAVDVFTTYTNGFNFTNTNGLQVGIDADGNGIFNNRVDKPIYLKTNNETRMRISRNATNNKTRVSITNGSDPWSPVSMLNIGDYQESGYVAGSRSWMNTGIFIYENTDNMYIGLKDEGEVRKDAVINWGDNFNNEGSGLGPDNLRFIYTSKSGGTGLSHGTNGKEIARMTYKDGIGRMGIDENDPIAKLHINASSPEVPATTGNPYLHMRFSRITMAGDASSDFQTMTSGNLLIHTYSGTASKNVGIGPYDFTTNNQNLQPQRRLDIFDDTNPQLRLTNTIASKYADLQASGDGYLLLLPSDERVGINILSTDLQQPTEALDIEGNARVRQLGDGTNLKGLVAYEDNSSSKEGTLHRLDFDYTNPTDVLHADGSWGPVSGGGGGDDMDWFVNSDGDVVTGWLGGTYPNMRVGVGTSSIDVSAKFVTQSGGDYNYSGYFSNDCSIAGGEFAAVYGESYSAQAYTSPPVSGVKGIVYGNKNLYSYGVWGSAGNGTNNYGVYGSSFGSGTNWAGYFDGPVASTYFETVTSDLKLKENIQPIVNSLDIISQLNPVTFNFKTGEYPGMNLSEKPSYGLIAQELLMVLPELIDSVVHPATFDALGNIVYEEVEYLSASYGSIIPILIKGIQQQQDSIEELNSIIAEHSARLDQIETLLGQCCSSAKIGVISNDVNHITVNSVVNSISDDLLNADDTELYQNTPNPFTKSTTFTYKLANPGKVELEVYSYTGEFISSLVSQYQSSGSYSVYWGVDNVPPGIYFYTLKVDGLEWVKKAVKIK